MREPMTTCSHLRSFLIRVINIPIDLLHAVRDCLFGRQSLIKNIYDTSSLIS